MLHRGLTLYATTINDDGVVKMQNILERIEKIEVTNESRLPIDDVEILEKYQSRFDQYRDMFLIYEEFYKNNKIKAPKYTEGYHFSYVDHEKMIEKLCSNFMKDCQSFIKEILSHFRDKYNVTLENNFEKGTEYCIRHREAEALERMSFYKSFDYNIIVDDIFNQLGGFNFEEKAINEIKEKARMTQTYCGYRKCWNYDVKGKTIKFRVNIYGIMPALYYYDNNEKQIIDYFTRNKVDGYKSYENGNTDIKFYDATYALEFAKKYLGYIEMSKEKREEIEKSQRY